MITSPPSTSRPVISQSIQINGWELYSLEFKTDFGSGDSAPPVTVPAAALLVVEVGVAMIPAAAAMIFCCCCNWVEGCCDAKDAIGVV